MSKNTVPDPKSFDKGSKSESRGPAVIARNKSEGESKVSESIENVNPSVAVWGCGGMGTNVVNKFGKDLPKSVDIRIIDTSKANLQATDYPTSIIQGEGSGQVRATNLSYINKFINSELFDGHEPTDINIVIFGASGGSGSVIGPLLLKELHRRDKAVIALIVADTASQKYTENTAKTFMSLQSICQQEDMYLPTMLFDNVHTRPIVDMTISHRLTRLCQFLTTDILERDKTDKINWLRPDKTVGAKPGVTGFHFSVGNASDHRKDSGEVMMKPKDHIFDSVFVVANNDNTQVVTDQRIIYQGIFRTSGEENIVASIGFPIADEFVSNLNARISKYESLASKASAIEIKSKGSSMESDGGIII